MPLPVITSRFLCRHTGKGSFQCPAFSVEDVDFEFLILPWGETHIRLSCPAAIPSLFNNKGAIAQYGAFSGITTDGFEVKVSRSFPDNVFQNNSGPTAKTDILLTGDCSTVIRQKENLGSASLRFHLVNLPIIGTERVETQSSSRLEIHLTLDQFDVRLCPVPDYEAVMATLEHTQEMGVTCHVIVSDVRPDQIVDAVNVVIKLCLILSLARGAKVTYPCYDVIFPDNKLLCSHYRACRKSTFHHWALIDYAKPLETKTFLQNAYPCIDQAIETWALDEVVELYADSKIELERINTRGIKAVICMEVLRAKFLKDRGVGEFIIEKELFKRARTSLEQELKQLLSQKFPQAKPDQLNEMASHAQGLNRAPFSRSIEEMCSRIKLPTSQSDIARFVKIRNKLVHSGTYPDEQTATSDYTFLDQFIGRFLLATLGYIRPKSP